MSNIQEKFREEWDINMFHVYETSVNTFNPNWFDEMVHSRSAVAAGKLKFSFGTQHIQMHKTYFNNGILRG